MNMIYKFTFLFLEISFLFLLINFLVAIIQQFLPPEKIQHLLGSQNKKGYFLSALLGSITPFCTCSTIPILKGFLKVGAGFGPTMVFLFSSPLLNPLIVTLFLTLLGWQVTLVYTGVALVFSILAGVFLNRFGFDTYIINGSISQSCCSSNKDNGSMEASPEASSCCSTINVSPKSSRMIYLYDAWKDSLKTYVSVLPHLLISITVGTLIYGYIPENYLAQYIGRETPLAIPIASVIGIPLYIRASVLIPIAETLVDKGVSLGAVVALIIGGAGASLPEVILLRSMFKPQLIVAFLFVILSMAMAAGYIIQMFPV